MAYEWITDALEQTWQSIDDVLRVQPPAAYESPTPCPGWSVRDVVSHLLGFELLQRGAPVPQYTGTMPDYVHNPIGELNEAFVAAHRGESGPSVLEQFRAVCAETLVHLRSLSPEEWERVGWSPEGERPFHRFQETRVVDSWIHLQDIRDALLQPEDDHGPGEEIVINRFESGLPYVFGKRVNATEGSALQVNLVGRLARTVLVKVIGGRAVAVPSLTFPADLEVTTPVSIFWRRAAGRISAEAFLRASATDVRGDRDLAQRFADGLVVMI